VGTLAASKTHRIDRDPKRSWERSIGDIEGTTVALKGGVRQLVFHRGKMNRKLEKKRHVLGEEAQGRGLDWGGINGGKSVRD